MGVIKEKKQSKDFFEILPNAIAALKKNIINPFFGESFRDKYENGSQPLRAELFTEQQLEKHAAALADRHTLITGIQSEQLLKRLSENEKIILQVHTILTETVKQNERITPAGEWMLDNFYLIEEQIYTGKKHLPKGYSKGLPRLLKGSSAGMPRVYDIAVEIISHSDGHVDLQNLVGFIKAYQHSTPLKLGELWAIPIMLRLALIENLRRLSVQIAIDISNKSLADFWADKMMDTSDNDPKNLVIVIADMARSEPSMESSFVAELTRRLQERGSTLSLALNWIEQRLSESGQTTNELVQLENQKQAADQVSISNSITSLRFLGTTDWREFVEDTSIMEAILSKDNSGVYTKMDFNTRDNYRHQVERIATHSNFSEQEIAEMVVSLAKEHEADNNSRLRHIGYYLTGNGLKVAMKLAKVRLSFGEACRQVAGNNPLFFYLGGILFFTLLITWPLSLKLFQEGLHHWPLYLIIVVVFLAASQVAVSIVNWLATILVKPALLPRMDFSKGIPDEYRGMIVIPTMLTSPEGVDNLAEKLEVHFLANRDNNLHFALLTDFKDAKQETMQDDDELLLAAKNKIIELNKKYQQGDNDIFLLFHRPRKWNKQEKVWLGFERKRGKLGELNALIAGEGKENFSLIIGNENAYSKIKYIITLDTDTDLPRDAAWKMIGTMAHPLNQAFYSEKKKRVTEGYGILQPRVSNSLPGLDSSLYAKMHGNEPGTDPYTRAISDVYQDLFGEGSFIGKGIYDVNIFEQALKDRLPLNRILSHDLLEGCYARSGLISDIQLYEEYPSAYISDAQRRHRWIRGDWQIANWILPFIRGFDKKFHKNPVSLLSKWKVFDNLRRSIIPLSLVVLLIYGWSLSSAAWFWTIIVLFIPLLTNLVNFTWELLHKPNDIFFKEHLSFSIRSISYHLAQYLINIICLPYELYNNSDAIIKTLWRRFVSHRKLLQWNPFSNSSSKKNLVQLYISMWFSPALAVVCFVYLSANVPISLIAALPLLISWFIAPSIAWVLSRPMENRKAVMNNEQKIYLRTLARKIWYFFESFVTEQDNWLPPDNYQEQPVERVAHRTSPTNIGFALLSNITAFDFGYITIGQLIEKVTNTIHTMQKMEKYRGHFYNWYDTMTLATMAPKYISTVDSGNLVGHLITLKQGLLSIAEKKIIHDSVFAGIADTLSVAVEKAADKKPLQKLYHEITGIGPSVMNDPEEIIKHLERIESFFYEANKEITAAKTEYDIWANKTCAQAKDFKNQLLSLLPWLVMNDVPGKFAHIIKSFPAVPTIRELANIEQSLLNEILSLQSDDNTDEENMWLDDFRNLITKAGRRAKEIIVTLEYLSTKCDELSFAEYDFLYDKSQHLLAIGYNADEHRLDNGYYDLLASEARLTTFVAIAQGKLPQESWFSLGRQLTSAGHTPILLSWSGSMFEYLMPLLIMPTYRNTLLDETNKGIIKKQIDYGKKRNIPWGISESGYNMVDANLNYQYKAFGVPGTGFKRGLGDDLVIAPYATVMALMIDHTAAYENLKTMEQDGFEGKYGFYEAVDYTQSRLQRAQNFSIIKSFMAHHQGMSFLSIAYVILNKPMQELFESDVQVKSALLLLQERIPKISTFYSPNVHTTDISVTAGLETPMRVIATPNTPVPEVQLLSNGRYHVMVTNSGGGYSRWKNISLTRWREDSTCDDWGTFCFIRDLDTNIYWSSAYQPLLTQGDNYEAVFSQGRAEFRRRDLSIETHTEIVVSPEDDIELRRVHLTNHSRKKRVIEITSYAEIILATSLADEMHPAFNNLFVQTEINQQRNAIIATQRPRTAEQQPPFMFHLMKAYNAEIKNISYETDRASLIGRTNSIHNPQVLRQSKPLSGSEGSVLDPIASIQYRLVIEPNKTATIDMIFGIADTREACNNLVEKYQDFNLTNRVLELAWTHSQVILRQINAVESDAQLYAKLASSIIFANASLRADMSVIIKNYRKQSGLWGYSISGDLPIVLLQIEDSSNIDLVKQLVQAHAYWRLKGLAVDLVIWNEDHGGYRQALHNQIISLIAPGLTTNTNDPAGGIFIRSADQVSNEDRILFQTVARAIISDRFGTLEEQLNRKSKSARLNIPYFNPTKFHASVESSITIPSNLQLFNGIGGFSPDGKEYIIATSPSQTTPAPWINVLANPQFGSIISESGQSYTWVENAHELRLSPWNNDPVCDLRGEAFYIRDEESGKFWSPSLLPCRGKGNYITRHGFGYSIFEYSEDGIDSAMSVYADINDPVKFIVIKLHNRSGRQRKFSVTGYVEWVLGDLRSRSLMHTITETDTRTGALLARNNYTPDFENRVCFFDTDDLNKSITADRSEFIGRNGTMSNPDSLNRVKLSGKTGAAYDPCAAIQTVFELSDEQEHEVVFRLGAGKDFIETVDIILKHKGTYAAKSALEKVLSYWDNTLNTVKIETPDPALNILTNGWLNYQSLASRIWGRSGFYQSGGAFGFRDQLQDVLSLMYSKPGIAKEQIIACASRQFPEGDVQHWWHPPAGKGVRTTCSDDYLWLPYVASRYVICTGDNEILNEMVPFIEGRLLNAGEESYYDLPIKSDKSTTVYGHCVRAIEHGLRFGDHGLPLIGSGDWNDGMDKVGNHGKGESVWLAFFLYDVLIKFIRIAQLKNDTAFAGKCKQNAEKLSDNIHQNAWDGEWYRRAYFDDGSPLGSKQNDECKIDSIAQSWAVLSKGGDPQRSTLALESAYKNLVCKDEKIIQLFDPPFDKSAINPGYIKGYVPGVRENGGQYTHAAIWLVMAFAMLDEKQRTWELLRMINPLNHSNTNDLINVYCVEPYVIAADVYAESNHKGRGGWTWYTGSAGWMYQLITEFFIGLKKEGNILTFNPCFPAEWPSVKVRYVFGETVYDITIEQPQQNNGESIAAIFLDNVEINEAGILLTDDRVPHTVRFVAGAVKETNSHAQQLLPDKKMPA